MKLRQLFRITMGLTFGLALLVVLTLVSETSFAQISPLPTSTFTLVPGTPTLTPTPLTPTPTNTPTRTPLPPTNTPPPPTNTPTPIPPTPTNTPAPPTNTPTPIPPPPTLGGFSIVPLAGVAEVGRAFDFTIFFTDPSILGIDYVAWDWGDGSSSTCPPDSATCSFVLVDGAPPVVTSDPGDEGYKVWMATGHHAYSEPGVYAVDFTVFDNAGQFDTSTFEFAIVYDPSGGFVTGGGWIDSPAGAYYPAPNLTGKATFGFVSKYKKGATVPTGNTEFQFKTAGLNFQSDTYHWLVVNQGGSNAQFKGEGTINGAVAPGGDNYRFMIWATDGDPDTLRIKIWYESSSGDISVYDNGFDQPIDGGNILVHKAKNAK